MTHRTLLVALTLLAMVCFVGQLAVADDKNQGVHEGKVVKAGNGSLTMTDKDGNQHTHKVAANAQITLDGKECKLEDLKAGTRIRVTPGTEADKAVTKIEGFSN